ncbi:MAG: thioredoxin 1 [Acidimicrobiaceae bacterium]|nr:thioredoxin 1 [Acidimicrobiaceae bacterium]
MSGVAELTDATFDEAIAGSKSVLVDFWAEWCQPCKAMVPTLEAIAAEHGDVLTVAKVDVGAFPDFSSRFKINGIPHLILFQEGEIMARITGAQPKEHVLRVVLPLIEAAADEAAADEAVG